MDNLSTGRSENIAHLIGHERFCFARETITNETVLDRLVSQVDGIFHLAAAVGVKLIVDDPVHTIETNIMGTEFVLKAALRYRCMVLIASTSEVYGKLTKIPFGEDDDVLIGPTSRSRWSYAASKMVDEFLGLAYHRQYKLPVVVFRLFNTIGPRQTGQYGMVLPRFVRQALRDEPLTVYGDGRQKRCFCDIRDVVPGLVRLSQLPEAVGTVFNVGSQEEISINELARTVIRVVESSSEIVHLPYENVYTEGFEDMRRRMPNIDRLQQMTGWKPKVSLETTIRSVADDLRRRLDG